jgi:hypothetical protein
MAIVPSSGTNLRFLSGIPFNSDYKHTRWFNSLSEQQNWWNSKTPVYTYSDFNIQRVDHTTFIRLNVDINDLFGVNYVTFYNEFHGRQFYAFITKLEYVQKGRTNVFIELDVLQTWMFDMIWQPSFVVREHCKLWNSDGSPVINTVPEDLNYGTEYDTVYASNIQPNNGYKWLVIVAKATMHNGANGTVIAPIDNGVPSPLSVYFIPFQVGKSAPNVHINNPGSFGVGDAQMSTPKDVLNAMYKMSNAVNNIVSIYITDHIGINVTVTDGNGTPDMITFPDGSQAGAVTVTDGTNSFYCMYANELQTYSATDIYAGGKYDNYKTVKESKLLMYPYTQLILDDFKGNRTTYKNEYINSSDITLTIKGSLGTSNKSSYGIQMYNSVSSSYRLNLSDEFAVINNEANDVPVVNDNLAAFLQGNRNSIANQKNSILWNGSMGAINGAISTAMSGMMMGPIGVAQGLGNTIQGAGNTALQLQAIQAKQNDISNIPPSISKMGSNSAYTFGNGFSGVFLIKKQIKDEYIDRLQDYFNMFGYKVNRVKFPNMNTRQYWNYVETKSCIIQGNFNNEDLEEIKQIFDSGITLWHTDNIGNYTLDNAVIA